MMVAIEKLTGQRPSLVWHKESSLDPIDLAIIPGGFSFGDYLRFPRRACGALAGVDAVLDHAARGGAVMGVCNGFQVLLETGLLPRRSVAECGAEIYLPQHHDGCVPSSLIALRKEILRSERA